MYRKAVTAMVFHEVYGNFNLTWWQHLSESIDGTLDDKRMYEMSKKKPLRKACYPFGSRKAGMGIIRKRLHHDAETPYKRQPH